MPLERDGEVATLDAFVSGGGRPGPRLGLIEGPAGIGKTTLLGEARRIVESDAIGVLSARGSTLERGFPYVTPKTVEVHLSNTYRKLEIGGRRQPEGALAT